MAKRALADDEALPDQSLFHSQQAAERGLKALLLAVDREVPRSHDLLLLVDELVEQFPVLEEKALPLARLSAYGVAPRYPGQWDETDPDVAHAALLTATETLLLVRRLLE